MPRKPKAASLKPGAEAKNYVPNNNIMSGIFDIPGIGGFGGLGGGQPIGQGNRGIASLSEPLELIYNESYYLLSVLRTVLTYAYTIHGPLRKVVNTPCYDAFRGGIKIKSDEVDDADLDNLHRGMKDRRVVHKVIDAMRWNRLYGGAGIIINTNQDYSKEFNVDSINENSKLSYIVADRWQLQWRGTPEAKGSSLQYSPSGNYVDSTCYINDLSPSRVCRVLGEEAPAIVRGRLAGWGMSVLEPIIRPINMYLKWENSLYEYIDQYKIDVVKIDGFNAGALSKFAKGVIDMRLRVAMWFKNFLNVVVMDSKDDFVQKQISLSGLGDIIEQIRINIACSCDMPLSKLFGLAASGFDSGESDLEVYNSMVENEREKAEKILDVIIPIEMMKTWGFVPDYWEIEWKKLRVLSEEQEQNVLNAKYTRAKGMLGDGVFVKGKEYADWLKKEGLLSMQTEVGDGKAELQPPMMAGEGMDEEEPPAKIGGAKKPSSGKKPKE